MVRRRVCARLTMVPLAPFFYLHKKNKSQNCTSTANLWKRHWQDASNKRFTTYPTRGFTKGSFYNTILRHPDILWIWHLAWAFWTCESPSPIPYWLQLETFLACKTDLRLITICQPQTAALESLSKYGTITFLIECHGLLVVTAQNPKLIWS